MEREEFWDDTRGVLGWNEVWDGTGGGLWWNGSRSGME